MEAPLSTCSRSPPHQHAKIMHTLPMQTSSSKNNNKAQETLQLGLTQLTQQSATRKRNTCSSHSLCLSLYQGCVCASLSLSLLTRPSFVRMKIHIFHPPSIQFRDTQTSTAHSGKTTHSTLAATPRERERERHTHRHSLASLRSLWLPPPLLSNTPAHILTVSLNQHPWSRSPLIPPRCPIPHPGPP